MKHSARWRIGYGLFPTLCLCLVLLGGCEEDVTAVLGTDRAFTLFGVFTPQADTQWVRVFPIEGRLNLTLPEPLDAQFTSTDLRTGERRVWSDSILQEADGRFAHVFWSPFRAEYGHTYRVEVERADGVVTRAAVEVPPFSELVLQQATVAPATQPVLVNGDVPRLNKIEVVYRFRFQRPGNNGSSTGALPLVYDGEQRRVPGGWVIPVFLSRDFFTIIRGLQNEGAVDLTFGVQLIGIDLGLIAANEPWVAPGGVFDPDVLVEPGTLSNVENGFGFIGAGYRLAATWVPDDAILSAAGFTVPSLAHRHPSR